MKIGIKEIFNKKNSYNSFGFDKKLEQSEIEYFKYFSTEDSFIRTCFKTETLVESPCTPFCVGNFDKRYTLGDSYIGASSSGAVLDLLQNKIDIAVCTDTGNSTIWPANRHNLYALKPTYGTISRRGLVPLCAKLDTIALMSKDPFFIKSIYYKVLEKDNLDLTQRDLLKTNQSKIDYQGISNKPLYLCESLFTKEDIEELKKVHKNIVIQKLDLPKDLPLILEGAYSYIMAPEFFSNMARFNGLFQKEDYEKGIKKNYSLTKIILERTKLLNLEIKKRILLGAYLLTPKNKSTSAYDQTLVDKLRNYLLKLLDGKRWIFPVLKNKNKMLNHYETGDGPSWPLVGNITGCPTAVIAHKPHIPNHFLLFPLCSDLELVQYISSLKKNL